MWIPQGQDRPNIIPRSSQLPNFVLFYYTMRSLSNKRVFCVNKKRMNILCYCYSKKNVKTWKQNLLGSLNTYFFLSWEVISVTKKKQAGFSEVPVKARRGRAFCAISLNLFAHPEVLLTLFFWLCVTRCEIGMEICQNKSVELSCSERGYLSSWGKGKK